MTVSVPGEGERLIIPRWRTFGQTVPLLESIGTRTPVAFIPDLAEAAGNFEEFPGLFSAGDLLSQALVKGEVAEYQQAVEEARRMLEGAGRVPPTSTSTEITDAPSLGQEGWRARVATNRRILRDEPRNGVRWVDLALAHLALGNLESSDRALHVALALTPDSRYALRALARLATIIRAEGAAQRIINASGAVRDPWVLAAELSLGEATGRGSRNTRLARALAASQSVPHRHLSELRGALSMAALRAGDRKTATRQARLSLIDPTENSVAQAEWGRHHGIQLSPDELPNLNQVRRAYEAEGRRLTAQGHFDVALEQCLLWLADQPFAAEAALFVSWLASTTENWGVAVAAAEQGLRISPEPMLRNNLAFALIHVGRLAEARSQLDAVERPAGEHVDATVAATLGLLAFREGQEREGRELYESAVRGFQEQRLAHLAALARLMQAREELRVGSVSARATLEEALTLAGMTSDRVVELWKNRLISRSESGDSIEGSSSVG